MQRIDDRQDSSTLLSMEKNLRALVLPFFLGIASFLLVDKMNNIETRMKKMEELLERTIELKYEMKKVQEDMQQLKSIQTQPTNSFPEKGDEKQHSPLIAILNESTLSLSKKRKK